MEKILIATQKPFAQVAVKRIKEMIVSSGYQASFLENYPEKSELINAVADADALIVRSDIVDQEVLHAAGKLKIVVRAGAGFDNIDCTEASKKNIVVMNTPGQNSNAVAELAVGLMIYGVREFFSGKQGGELRGRTLGLHGFGYVARNVFRIAQSFDMKVIAFTKHSKGDAVSLGLKVTDSLEELYRASDIVSIHVPARGEHIRSVNDDILKHLKAGGIIVNTARKEVIDEESLIKIMEQRPDLRYLSDIIPDCKEVFEQKFEGRYFFTPKKMGAETNEANMNAGIAAAEQIISYFRTGDETFRVNI
jgi:D-3-phosphoglycerate dehydrogenase